MQRFVRGNPVLFVGQYGLAASHKMKIDLDRSRIFFQDGGNGRAQVGPFQMGRDFNEQFRPSPKLPHGTGMNGCTGTGHGGTFLRFS